jgi:hypothetical protein
LRESVQMFEFVVHNICEYARVECVRETMGLMTEIQKVCIYIGNRERDRQTQGILMHVRERGKETGKRDRPFRRRDCKGLRSREFAEFDTEIELRWSFLGVTTFSIMTVRLTTLSIKTLSIMGLLATLSINDIQYISAIMLSVDYFNVILSGVMLIAFMLSVFMLNVIMLNVVMLNVVMLNVVMLSVVMLSVVAPFCG